MEISPVSQWSAALTRSQSDQDTPGSVQLAMVKKVMESQDLVARMLVKSMNSSASSPVSTAPRSKGQVVDIRV